jgi:hypothetical protein
MATLDADDLSAIDTIVRDITGTPVSLDSGPTTLTGMLIRMVAQDYATYSASTSSLESLYNASQNITKRSMVPAFLGVHTLRNGDFTPTWSGPDWTAGEKIVFFIKNLNSTGTDIDGGHEIGTLECSSETGGQPDKWTDIVPGGDGYADYDIIYFERTSNSSVLTEGWLTISMLNTSQFGAWSKRYHLSGYTDGQTNYILGARGEVYHNGASGLKVVLPAMEEIPQTYPAAITYTAAGEIASVTWSDSSIWTYNYTNNKLTSITKT